MTLALVTHPDRREARRAADTLVAAAAARGITVVEAADRLPQGTEAVIAVGGDGTVLSAARLAVEADVPILGINVGHVGYLAAADPGQIPDVVAAIATGTCVESQRMMIAASWEGGAATGLNDVVVEKVESQHAVRISLDIDDRHFTVYRADGVVVATPTGSTAYAFSAGGPMVDPELAALVVAPVAAHNLFAPPVLFAPTARLRFRAIAERPVRVNVDGREQTVLAPGTPLEVRRSERTARFLVPWPRYFDQVVREKFRLDGD